jgi:hypothetical protein
MMTIHKEEQKHSMLELIFNWKDKQGHSIVENAFSTHL